MRTRIVIAAALLATGSGLIPPTANVTLSPDYDIDLVSTRPRRTQVDAALVLARGHGGFAHSPAGAVPHG